jgi:hypothetical protein
MSQIALPPDDLLSSLPTDEVTFFNLPSTETRHTTTEETPKNIKKKPTKEKPEETSIVKKSGCRKVAGGQTEAESIVRKGWPSSITVHAAAHHTKNTD